MPALNVLQAAFEFTSAPMLLASEEGEILLTNEEFDHLFGYGDGELQGRRIEILIPPSIRSRHQLYVDAFARVPSKRPMGEGRALSGISKDGKEILLELSLETVTIEGAACNIVVAIDLRPQLRQQQKMELAMEASAAAMIMINDEGRIVLTNRAASELFGYEADTLLGKTVETLIPEEFHLPHRVYRANFAVFGEHKVMAQGRIVPARHRDGHQIPVEITLTPVEAPEGRMVMSTIVDLSERLRAEEEIYNKNQELLALNENLSAINRELSHFTYAVSHDLKAPLASILGLLRIVREDLSPEVDPEVLANIDRALGLCERHSQKVERILSFARAAEDQTPSSVCLKTLIDDIWDGIAPGTEVPAELALELEAEELVTSAVGLETILQNLISNAVKYHDPARERVEIHVTSHATEGGTEIAVADNGVGIPEEHRETVFDIFKRLDSRGGDGIGLALVRKQLDRLGGRIRVESEPGQGSTFRVFLPNMVEAQAA